MAQSEYAVSPTSETTEYVKLQNFLNRATNICEKAVNNSKPFYLIMCALFQLTFRKHNKEPASEPPTAKRAKKRKSKITCSIRKEKTLGYNIHMEIWQIQPKLVWYIIYEWVNEEKESWVLQVLLKSSMVMQESPITLTAY